MCEGVENPMPPDRNGDGTVYSGARYIGNTSYNDENRYYQIKAEQGIYSPPNAAFQPTTQGKTQWIN